MNKILTILLIVLGAVNTLPQSILTLNECYTKARENYPLIKQKEYIAKSMDYSVSNVWKGYFPQISISGQTTYQSDVTSIPISIPGMTIESLAKDQYKVVADVTQVIYDGGIMKAQADIHKAIADADNHKIEIEFLKVKDRINQIYFGILLLDEQLVQTNLIKRDLTSSLDKMKAALLNGTATKTNVDILQVELLKIVQREIELNSSRKSFIDMLGLMINQQLDESQKLEKPVYADVIEIEEINRPELNLFDSQKNLLEKQSSLTLAKILPKASLFFQGGYGKPALNMFNNNFDLYYIGGARLTWSISNLYTLGNENEITELNKKNIDAQKETFLLNTNISLKQHSSEFGKLIDLIKIDKEILVLRTSIKEAAKAQLENGVITSNDFIRELNAEDQAKQNLAIHTIQYSLAIRNWKITTGNN